MGHLSNNEFNVAWSALSHETQESGWRYIPVTTHGEVKIFAGRSFPENLEALLVGFKQFNTFNLSMLPQGGGFRVQIAELDEADDYWIALVRQPEGNIELFSMVVADIIVTLSESSRTDEGRLFQLFLGRIRAWQLFMKSGLAGLGPEAELGLFGELYCLEALLNAGVDLFGAVDSWVGPDDDLQDFELGFGAVEVKSTLSVDGHVARIQSLDQLDDSVRNPLFLGGFRFARDEKGGTLPELIERVADRFSLDQMALLHFRNRLLQVGYAEEYKDQYSRRLILIDCNFWMVDENFPRLIVGNVPEGVRSAKYEIELDHVEPFSCDVEEILAMLNGVSNGN